MGKIYYGVRGSGKTVKLLKQANALTEEGLIPIIIACHKDFFAVLKDYARQLDIDMTEWIFITFTEAMKSENRHYFHNDRYRVFIDELTVFIQEVLFGGSVNNGFYATLSSEDLKEIKKGDWKI